MKRGSQGDLNANELHHFGFKGLACDECLHAQHYLLRYMISPLVVTSDPCWAPPALEEPHIFFVACLSYLFK